jgi:hypothetical protein
MSLMCKLSRQAAELEYYVNKFISGKYRYNKPLSNLS